MAAAAQEQRKRSRSGIHQIASSADQTVRESVQRGTRRSSPKSDTQCGQELKCKTSAANTAAPCTRGRSRHVRSIHDNRGNVCDTGGSAVRYNEEHCKSGSSDRASTAQTFVARTKSRKQVFGKSDLVLPEEHPLEKYLERRHTSNRAAFCDSARHQGRHRVPANAFPTPAAVHPADATQLKIPAPLRKTASSAQDVVTQPHPRGLPQLTARTVDVQGVSSHPTGTRSDLHDSRASTLKSSPSSRLRHKASRLSH
ncbi:hypothetical protein EDB89DRAFT_1905044 [Lactarius sanguifluus]|nr:hypothetical protein EDB89DRAFT_1905044 [Lactarius sanguifluus]